MALPLPSATSPTLARLGNVQFNFAMRCSFVLISLDSIGVASSVGYLSRIERARATSCRADVVRRIRLI